MNFMPVESAISPGMWGFAAGRAPQSGMENQPRVGVNTNLQAEEVSLINSLSGCFHT